VPVLFEKDGRAMASSRDIAEAFGKRHDDVIKKFRDMDCSEDFRARNFAVLQNQTLSDPNYGKTSHVDMTRDGFTFLVMGFTGKDAAAWKEKYIAKAFGREHNDVLPILLSL
jgi:Rha family phage regulatory protein